MWKIIIITILVVFVASLLFAIFLSSSKDLSFSSLEKDIKKYETTNLDDLKKEVSPKEFVSSDGRLKLDYFSDWAEVIDEKKLEGLHPEDFKEEYESEVLLYAQRFRADQLAQLIVSKGNFGEKSNIEDILKIMEESNEEEGIETEIIKSKENENEITFEATYKKDNFSFHSKEKILIADNQTTYFVIFIISEKEWENLEDLAGEIIESVQLTEQNVL